MRSLHEMVLVSIYSTKLLPEDFGFGFDPLARDRADEMAEVVSTYGIVFYRDTHVGAYGARRPVAFVKDYRGDALWSIGAIDDDFNVMRWDDFSETLDKDGWMWTKFNESVNILFIHAGCVRMRR